MLLPNHCCHIWLNKYTVWVIVVQQRWITGSQINGGIQNSETQPLKQSRDVLHVRKIMMYQQPLHQQHIPQLHQGHFVTCKLITYRCPPCKGKTDVLVVIDKFSRWVEAYPTGRATATHTAKCLVTDFIPRWGLPDCIDSDQGTHFTGQVVKEVSRMLKIKWNLHCPYRPQASGQVERSNRTIKTRLSKMHQEGVPWVEALPAVLCSMRASPNRSVGLSPHEIITGRPMQMPGVIDLRNADVHIASDALIAYCENLTKAVQSAKERVESCWQTPPEGGHTIIPGQWVMIKSFRNKPLEPKWHGPHQVMLITAAAVLCQGRKAWTHVSHCKVVPPPTGIG